MSTNVPRDHHFIPEMLQKHFVDDAGEIWFINEAWKQKKAAHKAPKGVFFETDLYNKITEDGEIDPELEHKYGETENDAAPILKKILEAVRAGQLPKLKSDEKKIFDVFHYHLTKRVPEMHSKYFEGERLEKTKAEVKAILTEKYGSIPDEAEAFWANPIFLQLLKVEVLKADGGKVIDFLSGQGLAFARVKNKAHKFILGSMPLVSISTQKPKSNHLILPIASDVIIYPVGAPYGKEILHPECSNGFVERVNRTIARQSQIIGGSSKELVEGYARYL